MLWSFVINFTILLLTVDSETSLYVLIVKVKWSEVAQSCPTLCVPMDCSLPGSSIHGIFQARVLEWGAISFSRGSSLPGDWTQISHTAGRGFTVWATREALVKWGCKVKSWVILDLIKSLNLIKSFLLIDAQWSFF